MNKKERKANAALSNARQYVCDIKAVKAALTQPPGRRDPAPLPVINPDCKATTPKEKPKFMGWKVDEAEVKKLSKAHFFVVVTCGAQRIEVKKRFKSVTRANEWISKYK